MKLIAEYSWPLRDKVIRSFNSYPFFDQKKLVESTNEFLNEISNACQVPGFRADLKIMGD